MLDIIIPAAGQGYRMKSLGPKGLIRLGAETVLQRQIRILRQSLPESRIVVVGGFAHDKLFRSVAKLNVSFVVNQQYHITNVAHSIQVGMQFTRPTNPVLIVYGDLVFTEDILQGLSEDESSVILTGQPGRENEVGAAVVDGHVTRFSYGMPLRWAQIAMLTPADKALFYSRAGLPSRSRHFGYEILNELLHHKRRLKAVIPESLNLVEIDSANDILAARTMLTELTV